MLHNSKTVELSLITRSSETDVLIPLYHQQTGPSLVDVGKKAMLDIFFWLCVDV